jgi:hypothetical protein
MTENPNLQYCEKLALIQASRMVTCIEDLSQVGDPNTLLAQIGIQVSRQIADYNAAHAETVEFSSDHQPLVVTGHEMLPKTPEEIIAQFRARRSQIILTPEGKVIYHGTIYENFSPEIADYFGFQVVEFGTVITHPGFRGHGLGKLGVQKGLDCVAMENHNPISLSTIKRPDMASVFLRVGKRVIPFMDYPYLSYLTCTCENCSESHGFASCPFRRPHDQSTTEILRTEINQKPLNPLACTLMISDPNLASRFEARCRELDEDIQGSYLSPGEITVTSMTHAKDFFAKVKQHAAV